MKEKSNGKLQKLNKMGVVFLALSILLTLVATIVYGCVDYTHPAVFVFTILGMILGIAVCVLCFLDVLGGWKNVVVIGVPVCNIVALLVSIFGSVDMIGYWIDAKTPASSLQTFIASLVLLAVCVIVSVAAALNGVVKRKKKEKAL